MFIHQSGCGVPCCHDNELALRQCGACAVNGLPAGPDAFQPGHIAMAAPRHARRGQPHPRKFGRFDPAGFGMPQRCTVIFGEATGRQLPGAGGAHPVFGSRNMLTIRQPAGGSAARMVQTSLQYAGRRPVLTNWNPVMPVSVTQ